MSSLRALQASSLLGAALAIAYFLTRSAVVGSQPAFLQAPGLGTAAGLCGALYLLSAVIYFGKLPRARAVLESEIQDHLAVGRELQTRNAKAVRARDAKSQFLAKMSHELRTPMTAVIGYSEILIEDMLAAGKEAQNTDIHKIYDTGKHLLTVINDVLDISKIDAGKMQIFPEPVSLRELMTDVGAGCAALAAENCNSVLFDRVDSPAMVEVDCKKFRQLVRNLVAMANHVVREGEIRVTCAGQGGWIDVSVSTTRGNIMAENLAHVSGDVEAGNADHTPDAVLGFALAKKLCQVMGGIFREEGQSGFRVSIQIPSSAKAVMAAGVLPNAVIEAEKQFFAMPEMLSQPLDEQSPLIKVFRNCYRRLFPNREKAVLIS